MESKSSKFSGDISPMSMDGQLKILERLSVTPSMNKPDAVSLWNKNKDPKVKPNPMIENSK